MKHKPFPTTPLLLLAGILIGFLIGRFTWQTEIPAGPDDTPPVVTAVQKSAENQSPLPEPAIPPKATDEIPGVSADDDFVMGDPSAPVLIVEFTDYQCPYCKRYFEDVFRRIDVDYIRTGKVRYAVRDFPLDEHPQALLAANAAECAGEQGRYPEMHEMLFAGQDHWSYRSEALSVFKTYGQGLDIDTTIFNDCLETGKYEPEIAKDIADAASYTVRSVPTIFINGQKIVGSQSYDLFKRTIEAELAKAQRSIPEETV